MPVAPPITKLLQRIEDAGDLPEPPDRDLLIRVLGVQARNGHVPAIRLLLEELRRDDDSDSKATPLDTVDQLAERRAS